MVTNNVLCTVRRLNGAEIILVDEKIRLDTEQKRKGENEMITIKEMLTEKVDEIFAEMQSARGIEYGDVSPMAMLELEQKMNELSELIDSTLKEQETEQKRNHLREQAIKFLIVSHGWNYHGAEAIVDTLTEETDIEDITLKDLVDASENHADR